MLRHANGYGDTAANSGDRRYELVPHTAMLRPVNDSSDTSADSAKRNYERIFAGCSVAKLHKESVSDQTGEPKKIVPQWTIADKTVTFSHAITYRYAKRALPDPSILLHLAHLLNLPTGYGADLTKQCLNMLVGLIESLTSPETTHGLTRIHNMAHREYRVEIASVLIEAVDDTTQTAPDFITSFDLKSLRGPQSELPLKHIATNCSFVTLPLCDEVSKGKTSLVQHCMHLLSSTSQFTGKEGAASIVQNPYAQAIGKTSGAFRSLPSRSDVYGPPQPDAALLAARLAQESAFLSFLDWMETTSLDIQAGNHFDQARYEALWDWNGGKMERKPGTDYLKWEQIY